MIRNYLKVAFRSIFRNKLTAFINIAGLALAMMCCILIYLFVSDELNYDRYHEKADRIYRVTRNFLDKDGEPNLHLANVAPPIGPLLKNDFGEIEVMARTINFGLVIGLEEDGELVKNFSENYLFLAEPEIFKIFDIAITAGDPASLSRPFTIMLSEKSANKFFDQENPLGKRLRANNQFDLEITGVYKDFPAQSHWHPEYLVSFSTLENDNIYGRNGLETNWGNNSFGTYLLLEEGAYPKKVEAGLPDFMERHFANFAKANWGAAPDFTASKATTLFLQKLTDIHLYSHLDDELEVNGNINNVKMMGVIGLFIILIACFNFINLSTARATKRAKEVGLRKVVGAFKSQLVNQYLSESVLISIFALVLAIIISGMALSWLNIFTGKSLSLNPTSNWPLFLGLIGFAVVVGLIAGIYPAFVLSSFKPALVLKGQQGSVKGKGFVRKSLVVAQFSISIVLLIATAITFQQLRYLNTFNLGYDKDQVVTLGYYNEELADNYEAFYNELLQSSAIENAGRSSRIPTGRLLDSSGPPMITIGDSLISSSVTTKYVAIDEEFFKTYGMDIAAGRDLSKAVPTDDSLAFIVNETAAKAYGWKNPSDGLEKDFSYANIKGKLVGIVKDFHFESLHQSIVPIVFWSRPGIFSDLSIRISGNQMQEGLQHIEKVWKEFLPNRPFTYQFLSQSYQRLYQEEQKQSQLFTLFSGLAIFIACLGLFGLATFNTLQRVKEIGIRKVLGASVSSILALLSQEIVILIVLANLLAWPLAWYAMNQWLASFAYHIDMNAGVYILSAMAAIALALVTVSTQTIKAAMTNPGNTLRYE